MVSKKDTKKIIKEYICSIIERCKEDCNKEVQKNISVYTLKGNNGMIKVYQSNKNKEDISFQITEEDNGRYEKNAELIIIYSGTFNGLKEVKTKFNYPDGKERTSFLARDFDAGPELKKKFMQFLQSYATSK